MSTGTRENFQDNKILTADFEIPLIRFHHATCGARQPDDLSLKGERRPLRAWLLDWVGGVTTDRLSHLNWANKNDHNNSEEAETNVQKWHRNIIHSASKDDQPTVQNSLNELTRWTAREPNLR